MNTGVTTVEEGFNLYKKMRFMECSFNIRNGKHNEELKKFIEEKEKK